MQIALLYGAVAGAMPDYSKSPSAQKAALAGLTPASAPASATASAPEQSVAVPRSAPTAITRDTETLSSTQTTDGSQGVSASGGGGGGGNAAAPKPALRSAAGSQGGPIVPNPADQQPGGVHFYVAAK